MSASLSRPAHRIVLSATGTLQNILKVCARTPSVYPQIYPARRRRRTPKPGEDSNVNWRDQMRVADNLVELSVGHSQNFVRVAERLPGEGKRSRVRQRTRRCDEIGNFADLGLVD